jgi:tetratricopeptide (TPR) repeat protein
MTAKTRKEQIQEMLVDEPNDPFLRYGLAMEYIGEGNDEQAVKHFRDLLRVAPEYVAAYQQAGQTLHRLGQDAEAGELLRLGIQTALKQNNEHAAAEMQELLASLG